MGDRKTKRLGAFFSSAKNIVHILFALVLLVVALCTILAPVVSPVRTPFLAYFGLLFPFIFLGFLLILLICIVLRNWKGVLFSSFLLLLLLPQLLVYFPIRLPARSIPNKQVTLLSLNVMAFQYEPHSTKHPNPTLAYIRNVDADIVCLQEAFLVKQGKSRLTLPMIKSFLPQYRYIDYRKAQPDGGDMMLLSKYPILYARRLPTKSKFNGVVSYRLAVDDKELELFNVHLETTGVKANDGETYLELVKEGKAVELTKQIGLKLSPSFALRAKQSERIALEVDKTLRTTPYVIVCGDFNDTPISYARKRLTANLVDLYATTGRGAGYTFYLKGMGFRIDHILASKAIRGYTCFVDGTARVSDHKPIHCSFVLGEE